MAKEEEDFVVGEGAFVEGKAPMTPKKDSNEIYSLHSLSFEFFAKERRDEHALRNGTCRMGISSLRLWQGEVLESRVVRGTDSTMGASNQGGRDSVSRGAGQFPAGRLEPG
jgi:hypothetical protein